MADEFPGQGGKPLRERPRFGPGLPPLTSRQRFHATMQFGQPDRVPLFEEGLREDVREAWAGQGLPRNEDLHAAFHYDPHRRLELGLKPSPECPLLPPSDEALAELRARLDADDPVRLPDDWEAFVDGARDRDWILELPVNRGLFLTFGVHDWRSLVEMIYALADDPAYVRRVMDIHAAFISRRVTAALQRIEVDFASFSEPIGCTHAPLISPTMYKSIVLDSYRPILDALKSFRVPTIVFATYANARPLLGDLVDAGFNCLWAMETETRAMDYRDIRKQFGRSLVLIGGIDLDVLLTDRSAIRRELDEKVPALLADGGFIPLADGRVRSSMPFDNYRYYRTELERMCGVR